MYLLQKAVSAVARLIRGSYLADVRKKHPIVGLLDTDGTAAFAALDNDFYLSILLPLRLQNAAKRSYGIDLVRRWLIDRRIVLRCEKNVAIAGHRLFECANGAGSADLERNFCEGENYDVTYGHHRITLNVRRHLVAKFLHKFEELLLKLRQLDGQGYRYIYAKYRTKINDFVTHEKIPELSRRSMPSKHRLWLCASKSYRYCQTEQINAD
jgi:hypothetical protein